MSKKIYFLLIVVILLLIVVGVAGFLFWQKLKPTPIEDFDTAKISPRRNFEVKEEAGRKVIENKKDGLRFSVPQDWVLKEDVLRGVGSVDLYSPDAEIGDKEFIIKKGCKVAVSFVYIRTNLNTFENYLKERFNRISLFTNNQYERIKIGNYDAIKHSGTILNNKTARIDVYIPLNNRVVDILLSSSFQDKERCAKEFDEILKTVSIKKKLF
jgi:hypothetical protein